MSNAKILKVMKKVDKDLQKKKGKGLDRNQATREMLKRQLPKKTVFDSGEYMTGKQTGDKLPSQIEMKGTKHFRRFKESDRRSRKKK